MHLPRATSLIVLATAIACVGAPAASAATDTTPPLLQSVTIPSQVSSPTVGVAIRASDDTAVAQVRLANEDGTWAAWGPAAATVDWSLSPGTGAKAVFVQVRDGAGNESAVVLTRLARIAPAAATATATTTAPLTVTAPATATQPTAPVTGDEPIVVRGEHGEGPARVVITVDGGVSAAGAAELDLAGLNLPRRGNSRARVVSLLRDLHASGRTGRHSIAVLRRTRADIRVADLSSFGAAGLWYDQGNRLVLDRGFIHRGRIWRTAILGTIAHEASHAMWDRRDYASLVQRRGGGPTAQLLVNEAVADTIGDQVQADAGGTPMHPSLLGSYRWHLQSDFYADWYDLDARELRAARQQGPHVLRGFVGDLVDIGVDRARVTRGLTG